MNLKTRPVLIAASIGGLLHVIFALAIQLFSTFAISKFVTELQTQTRNALLLAALVSLGGCLCNAGLDTLIGATYAWLYPRAEPLTPGDGLLGGGAASALARLVGGGVALLIGLLLLPITFRQLGYPTDMTEPILTRSMAQGLIGGVIGLIIGVVLAALFGAVGGVVVALIRERRSGQLSGAGLL